MASRRLTQGVGVAFLLAALTASPSLSLDPNRAMTQYHRRFDSLLGTVQPAGCRLADGRLCFTTTAGLALVDPRRPRLEVERAPVLLERVLVDGRAVPIGDTAIEVPPGRRSVEVAYTVPSFVRPDRLRFRTWLEGFDDDWVEVGERRTAYYTGLRPGRYRFRVSAGDLDSGWAPGEAGFELIVGARPGALPLRGGGA